MTDRPDLLAMSQHFCFEAYALEKAFGRYYQSLFGDTGLTYPKYLVLLALQENGPLSVGQLSAIVGVETNTLSPLLKRMAEFGAIHRARAADDERRVDLSLTELGEKVLTAANQTLQQGWGELGLDQKSVDSAVALMRLARSRLEQVDPPRMPTSVDPD